MSLFWDMVKSPKEEQLKGKLEAIRLESNEAYLNKQRPYVFL